MTVASGLSRPYFFRSAGEALSAAIDFICTVCRRPTRPSTDPKSALVCTGLEIFHSPPSLAIASVWPPAVMSSASTLSRSNFSSVLSRKSKVVRLNEVSCAAAIRKTFFSSLRLAKKSPPVGVLSPMYSLR